MPLMDGPRYCKCDILGNLVHIYTTNSDSKRNSVKHDMMNNNCDNKTKYYYFSYFSS